MKLLEKTYRISTTSYPSPWAFINLNALILEDSFVCPEHKFLTVRMFEHPGSQGEIDPLGVVPLSGGMIVYHHSVEIPVSSGEWDPPFGTNTTSTFLVRMKYQPADVLDQWELFEDVPEKCACPSYVTAPPKQDGAELAEAMRTQAFPAASYGVDYGCPVTYCETELQLWNMVIHLNDLHHWRREEIADYLEELAEQEGLDLSFPVPETIPKEPGEV